MSMNLKLFIRRIRARSRKFKVSTPSGDGTTVSSTEREDAQGDLATPATTVRIETFRKDASQTQLALPERSIPRSMTPPKGECGLYALHNSAHTNYTLAEGQFPVDIVAVHGMDGGARKTWTHPNKHYWLQDSLPNEFPGARIYSFGYPADVLFSREKSDISDFAKALLEEVKGERISKEDQRRPLIFVCHSMGGIIVKKAFNISVVNEERYGIIRQAVPAIVFLATPHRGSDYADFFKGIAGLVNVPILGTAYTGKIRNDLIKSLSKHSTALSEISQDFRHHTKDLKIYSFLETMSTPPLRQKVVDDMSGCLGVDTETEMPMPGCDHRTICRFSGNDDVNYKRVLRVLQEIATEATDNFIAELTAEDEPCLHSLSFQNMTSRQQETSLSTSDANSCSWILSHPSFNSWVSEESSDNLLWIKGHPGTGKSTLMSFLYHQYIVRQNKDTIILTFFFHGNGSSLQKTELGMFRSLLHQIYKQSFDARKMILKCYQKKIKERGECDKDLEWQVSELRELFTSIITSSSSVDGLRWRKKEKKVLIFIDALDESFSTTKEKAAKELVTYFHFLREETQRVGNGRKVVKTCISSRHYPIISTTFGVTINVEKENTLNMASYISRQLKLGVEDWNTNNDGEREALEQALVSKAAGVFLWAKLRIKEIVKGLNNGVYSLKDITKILEDKSNDLFALYSSILLTDIEVRYRAQALLFMQWVSLAERPLSLTEIRYAMACDESVLGDELESCEHVRGFVDEDSRMERLTKSLSGGLAEVRGGTVQLFHQSVNDFLTEGGLSILYQAANPKSKQRSDQEILGESESRLSASCLNYLRLEETFRTACLSLEDIEETRVFIEYATKYWAVHAERAERYGVAQVSVTQFFDKWGDAFYTWKMVYTAIAGCDVRCPLRESSLAHVAARHNLKSVLTCLLERDPGLLEGIDNDGNKPLHDAASFGHGETVKILLDKGADLDATNLAVKTSLVLAAASGHEDIVKLLLNHATLTNASEGQMRNALQAPASSGNAKLVALLLRAGADINARTERIGTALQEACTTGKTQVVELLLKHGADPNAHGGHSGTALQQAIHGPTATRREIVDLLLDYGADVNARAGSCGNALQAAAWRDVDILQKLLDYGANINAIDGEFGSALQAAATYRCEEGFRILLERGADINIQGGESGCALHAAAAAGCIEIVELMLNKGADVHIRGGKYDNVIQAASASVEPEIVPWLLERGARADFKGGVYGNVLQAAICGDNVELAKTFLADGNDINETGGMYGTALQAAVMRCKADFIAFLIDQGADVNGEGGKYGSPLRAAVFLRKVDIVRLLLQKGADPNVMDEQDLYCDALQIAAARGDLSIVEALIEYGADVCRQGGWYGNALCVAVESENKPVVQLLLDKGADWTSPGGIFINSFDAAKWGSNPNIGFVLLNHPSWRPKQIARLEALAMSKMQPEI